MKKVDYINKMEEKIKYSKNCPQCGCEQLYGTKYTLIKCIDLNQKCHKCSAINKKLFTNDEIDNIILLYKKNKLSLTKIGELYNMSKGPIINVIKNAGLSKKRKSPNKIILTNEDEINIIKMFLEEHKSNKEISIIYGVSRPFITKLIKKHNIYVDRSKRASIGLVKFHNKVSYSEYLKNLPEFKKYRTVVNRITRNQPIELLHFYNKRGKSGLKDSYQLDHKYSILEGFKNKIPPEIIGNINNLEFIPWKENIRKGTKCSITITELINKIKCQLV